MHLAAQVSGSHFLPEGIASPVNGDRNDCLAGSHRLRKYHSTIGAVVRERNDVYGGTFAQCDATCGKVNGSTGDGVLYLNRLVKIIPPGGLKASTHSQLDGDARHKVLVLQADSLVSWHYLCRLCPQEVAGFVACH